jgi:pimeloyl-ACP methyl ester carboxylesterase
MTKETLWRNEFRQLEFEFEGRYATLIFPPEGTANQRWMLKTEYFGAFPALELEMLARGWHLAYVKNVTRWCLDEDLERKARFAAFLHTEYGLCPRCVPVGMSCGGLIAIKFAAKYPEMVECLYLDGPVVNYMSCPCGFGVGEVLGGGSAIPEILNALQLPDVAHLMAYREMPLDKLPALVAAKSPPSW